VLIHGLFADAESYTLVARRLAKGGLRVLAVDLPGHGGSSAVANSLDQLVEATATVLRAVAVGPVNLVGHSLGAIIAAKLAARREVELQQLVLLAPAGLGKEIDSGFVNGMIEADSVTDLEREIAKLDGGALSASYLAELLSRIRSRRPMLRDLAASVTDEGGQRHSIVADLEGAKIPIAAVFGLRDRIIPWQHATQLPQRAAVHFVKAAGHMPHWTAPNLVAELLLGSR
ncbi:MAG: alpha/beta fold hydrolase, partial [Dongiaceae bacterium]